MWVFVILDFYDKGFRDLLMYLLIHANGGVCFSLGFQYCLCSETGVGKINLVVFRARNSCSCGRMRL